MELNVPFGMKKAMGTNHMKHATNVLFKNISG
jgi:hypothetical protein